VRKIIRHSLMASSPLASDVTFGVNWGEEKLAG
jgi:hypothetical protein